MKKAFFTLALLTSMALPINGAPSKGKSKKDFYSMKRKLTSYSKSLSILRKKIGNLENELGDKNKKILDVIDAKKQIEISLYDSEIRLEKSGEELEKLLNETKSSLRAIVLGNLDDVETSSDLLSKKIIAGVLQKKINNIQEEISHNKQLKEDIELLKSRYKNFLRVEQDLRIVLENLELRKKSYADKYVETEKEKDEVQIKLDKVRSKIARSKSKTKTRKSSIKMRFSSPIESFTGFDHGKKGITFKFKKRQPVIASRTGKISYVGSLSNYGNVTIIDHGSQMRSVYLGSFQPRLKKGDKVKKGQLLGYTKIGYDNTKAGNLYFEVRKKNKAQNTVHLMDRIFQTKTKVAKR